MARANKSVFIIATNEPYSLGVIRTPGECGADIACGDAQAFGSPTSFGGPSLGFMAVSRKLMRKIPGRLCGKTVDRDGNEGFVLTLQAREQHIRREKSSSNICSNEALCALAATVHLSLLGKGGFADTARNNLDKAHYAAERISSIDGFSMRFKSPFFNEFAIRCLRESPEAIVERLAERGIGAGVPLGRFFPGMKDCLLIAVTEMNTKEDIDEFADALAEGQSSLYDGVAKLQEAMPALTDGVTQLRDGAMELSDGLQTFYDEGISKILEAADEDLPELLNRMRTISSLSTGYRSFSGIAPDMTGTVKFIYRTEEIGG